MILSLYYYKLSVRSARTLREELGKTISFILVMIAFSVSGLLKTRREVCGISAKAQRPVRVNI